MNPTILLSNIASMVRQFTRLSLAGKRLLTTSFKPFYYNRTVSGKVEVEGKAIKLDEFCPGRDKPRAIARLYASGKLDDKKAIVELQRLVAYCVLCVLTGTFPSPSGIAAESLLKARVCLEILASMGWSLGKVEVSPTIAYNGNEAMGVLNAFARVLDSADIAEDEDIDPDIVDL